MFIIILPKWDINKIQHKPAIFLSLFFKEILIQCMYNEKLEVLLVKIR